MFIVPLAGDRIETAGAVKHTVLSYTNYRDKPAVYVETPSTVSALTVPFSSIISVNGTGVTLDQGQVLISIGKVKRRLHLPQKGDIVTIAGMHIKVHRLKLNASGKLASGMIVVGTDDEKAAVSKRLIDLEEIESIKFDREVFLALYRDYLGAGQ